MRLLLSLLLVATAAASAATDDVAQRPIADFTLSDFQGQQFSLSEYAEQRFVVVVFFGVDCPLAKRYGPRLDKLAAEYGPRRVALIGIDSNSQDSITEIAAFARTQGIRFPLLRDAGNVVADRFAAERTPEVFVLDERRTIRYRGRVDDQYAPGGVRPEPKQHDLRRALDELLAGKPVTQPRTEVAGCLIGRVRPADATSLVTYEDDVAAILQRRCVECHRPGQIGPFSLTDFDGVSGWAEMIGEVVAEGRMPPWHADPKIGRFVGDRHLSDDEKQLIKTWVAAGAPRGTPRPAPASENASVDEVASLLPADPQPAAAGEWQLPRPPDVVIPMSSTPFQVPLQGPIGYQFFKVDPGYQEDRWISAAEVVPGNRTVVHHVVVHALKGSPDTALVDGTSDGYLAVFVPGMRVAAYPPGMAKRITAGSQLLFQVHYAPNGTPQTDCCKIGLVFADPKDVEYEVFTSSVLSRTMAIPPGAARYRVTARSSRAPAQCLLLSMMPHMHLRGTSFSYELILPGGKSEMLLDVPRYDPNWQTAYRLVEPRALPMGSQLRCVANFDNSDSNLNNPDSTKKVGWGLQTTDEMMVGYFDVALPKGQKPPPPPDLKLFLKAGRAARR